MTSAELGYDSIKPFNDSELSKQRGKDRKVRKAIEIAQKIYSGDITYIAAASSWLTPNQLAKVQVHAQSEMEGDVLQRSIPKVQHQIKLSILEEDVSDSEESLPKPKKLRETMKSVTEGSIHDDHLFMLNDENNKDKMIKSRKPITIRKSKDNDRTQVEHYKRIEKESESAKKNFEENSGYLGKVRKNSQPMSQENPEKLKPATQAKMDSPANKFSKQKTVFTEDLKFNFGNNLPQDSPGIQSGKKNNQSNKKGQRQHDGTDYSSKIEKTAMKPQKENPSPIKSHSKGPRTPKNQSSQKNKIALSNSKKMGETGKPTENIVATEQSQESSIHTEILEGIYQDKKTIGFNLKDIIPIKGDKRSKQTISSNSIRVESDEESHNKMLEDRLGVEEIDESLMLLSLEQRNRVFELERNLKKIMTVLEKIETEVEKGTFIQISLLEKTCLGLKQLIKDSEMDKVPPEILFKLSFGYSLNNILRIMKKMEGFVPVNHRDIMNSLEDAIDEMDQKVVDSVE